MNRRAAYLAALKYFYQRAIVGVPLGNRRAQWLQAKNDAAVYAFLAPTENLKTWVRNDAAVWI